LVTIKYSQLDMVWMNFVLFYFVVAVLGIQLGSCLVASAILLSCIPSPPIISSFELQEFLQCHVIHPPLSNETRHLTLIT
jgi:hypothetical protein